MPDKRMLFPDSFSKIKNGDVAIKIDKIIRSKRKTLGLEIAHDASLIVRVPHNVSLNDIQKVVFEKRDWIANKQRFIRERRLKAFPKKFLDIEEFFYLGESYPLVILENAQSPLLFDREFQLRRENLLSAKRLFVDWYKKQASLKIKERLDFYSDLLGYEYNKFGISNAKRRWGSCNGKGNIYVNWRLIMAPLDVIDYVVAHELTHLAHRNHSRKFWNRMEIIQSDYKQRRKWLKENGHLLMIDNCC
ncbi:MAG: SprT family zinc-dependent metalloprotease [Candidatus Omnitrophota bacterium]|nr:M48 family metallopeptidase [Candidatus Omnitrophota bacterium]MBU1630723.1 M48 family metallopeptidase [Candidatus Omnitrophota bacterium]